MVPLARCTTAYGDVTKTLLKYYFLGTIVVLLEYHWCTSGIHEHCRGNTTVGMGLYSTGVPERSDSGECLVVSVTG